MDIKAEIEEIKARLDKLEGKQPAKSWFPELTKSEESEMVFKSKIEELNRDRN